MRDAVAEGHRAGRDIVRIVVAATALLVLAVAGAPRATAAGHPPAPHAPVAQDEQLARLLRRDPVYVSDQMPHSIPRSWQPRFAALARRTGVPTFLLVLPSQEARDDSLLAGVHDRLGRPGVYVLMSDGSPLKAVAFGVNAPAADAETVANYSTPFDGGPLRLLRAFADTVREGPDKAARRADALESLAEKSTSHDGLVPPAYISQDDRDNQSFTTGAWLMGAPLSVLLLGLYAIRLLYRRRHPRPLPEKKRGRKPAGKRAVKPLGKPAATSLDKSAGKAGARGGRRWPWFAAVAVVAVAAALAVAIGVIAPRVYDQTLDGPLVHPTRADLTARIDRVTTGLERDPVYQDPESPPQFTGAQLAALERRIAAFTPGHVYVAAVPMDPDDESGGDTAAFLTVLHRATGRPGLYVVADTANGELDVRYWGLKLKPYPVPDAITEIPPGFSDDHRFAQRLDRLMTFLDHDPRAAQPYDYGYAVEPGPFYDSRLAPLFSGEFADGLSLVGVLVTLGFLLLVGCVALARRLRAARRARAAAPAAGAGPGRAEAPATPGTGYLRRSAQQAIDALAAEVAAAGDAATANATAYACLDAALLLVDREADGRIDDGTSAADLVAALVLARAGQEELAGRPVRYVCGINPLHGRADARRPGRGPGRIRVCGPCLGRLRRSGGDPADRRLRLPARHGSTPYEEATGALPHVREGIAVLIEKVKEYAHVQ